MKFKVFSLSIGENMMGKDGKAKFTRYVTGIDFILNLLKRISANCGNFEDKNTIYLIALQDVEDYILPRIISIDPKVGVKTLIDKTQQADYLYDKGLLTIYIYPTNIGLEKINTSTFQEMGTVLNIKFGGKVYSIINIDLLNGNDKIYASVFDAANQYPDVIICGYWSSIFNFKYSIKPLDEFAQRQQQAENNDPSAQYEEGEDKKNTKKVFLSHLLADDPLTKYISQNPNQFKEVNIDFIPSSTYKQTVSDSTFADDNDPDSSVGYPERIFCKGANLNPNTYKMLVGTGAGVLQHRPVMVDIDIVAPVAADAPVAACPVCPVCPRGGSRKRRKKPKSKRNKRKLRSHAH